MLRLILRMSVMRDTWADVWIELYQREVIEPAREAADEDSGPWLVAPPPGMH